MFHYKIQHVTRFFYGSAVRESIMEVRMRPRDEWGQSCLFFELNVSPRCPVSMYRDYLGNHVHHFDIPATHMHETLTADSIVKVDPPAVLPEALDPDAWDEYTQANDDALTWEMTQPSPFCQRTPAVEAFVDELGLGRRSDPLTTVREVGKAVYDAFEYRTDSTDVDTTVDEALGKRAGVCQDLAHVMITVCRHLGVPARYVSGYLFVPEDERTRLGEAAADATHAWVEVYLPGWGWFGYDPTHEHFVGGRHVRTAVGRDYRDVPPSRGIYRGQTESRVEVAVEVTALDEPPTYLSRSFETTGWVPPEPPQDIPDEPQPFEYFAQQMQQQQDEGGQTQTMGGMTQLQRPRTRAQ